MYDASGGWPAALPWAIAQAAGDSEASKERIALCRFLDEEVWRALDQPFIDHLADAALLAPVTFETLDSARQASDSALLAARLADTPVPLVTVSEGNLITVHPLIRACLQAHRSHVDRAAQRELLRLAAGHLSRSDRDDEAFRMWLATRDRSALIDFVSAAGRRAALQGRVQTARRWLAEFSPEELVREVRLQAVAMGIDAAEGNLAAAADWVRRMRSLDLPGDGHAAELNGILSAMMALEEAPATDVEAKGFWGVISRLMDGGWRARRRRGRVGR